MAQNDLSIEGIDLGYWKHPRTGEERWYVNNYEELVGLELHHYNTGNICSAYLNGEKISNYRAKQLLRSFGKVWLTADGTIHTQYEGEMTATVVEAIKTAQAAQAAAEPAPEPADEEAPAPSPERKTIMTQTLVTTWARLFGETLESSANVDPSGELDLTDSQREALSTVCVAALITEANRVLEPWDAELIGIGEILGDIDGSWRNLDDEGWEDVKAELSSIDLADTLDAFLADLPEDEPEEEDAPKRWPDSYAGFLTKMDIRKLDRCRSADAALTLSGQFPDVDTLWARLAYVSAKSGWKAARATEREIEQADLAGQADRTPAKRGRVVLKAAFTRAWEAGRAAWVAEHDAQCSGERMSGPVMRALRTTMGLDQAQLAQRLRVGERAVRAWESGEILANTGVSAEVWSMWDEWITAMHREIPEGDVPVFPADTDPAILRAAAAILDGARFSTEPAPLFYNAWAEDELD